LVIGKISGLATTIFVFAIGIIFLKQAYSTGIGTAGRDVGSGLQGTASGVSALIDSFISPILNIGNIFTNFFGSITGSSNDGTRTNNNSNDEGRSNRQTPTDKVASTDVVTVRGYDPVTGYVGVPRSDIPTWLGGTKVV